MPQTWQASNSDNDIMLTAVSWTYAITLELY